MDRYVVPRSSSPPQKQKPFLKYSSLSPFLPLSLKTFFPKSFLFAELLLFFLLSATRRPRWKMCAAELDGRILPKHQHQLSGPLIESYTEVAEFPHHYKIGDEDCPTHETCMPHYLRRSPVQREGISGMEFDNKGIYLASVTKSGCLMIHDFETLYSLSNGPSIKFCFARKPNEVLGLYLTILVERSMPGRLLAANVVTPKRARGHSILPSPKPPSISRRLENDHRKHL